MNARMLNSDKREQARAFIYESARPLEQCLYAYRFENGSADAVLNELRRYQNQDGGFGNALEPDLRVQDSSAIATTVAMQTLRGLAVPAEHEIVTRAIRYFLDTYDAEQQAWMSIPPTVDSAPHAPWWIFSGDFEKVLANPRAEIAGYFVEYADQVPPEFLETLVEAVLSHLDSMPEKMDMHDLLCYLRFFESKGLAEQVRARVFAKLERAVDATVGRNTEQWGDYGLPPLKIVTSSTSPFADMLADEVALNLDYEIEHQGNDGAWSPNWSWGGTFPDVWEKAQIEWKGIWTLNTLRILDNHGRIADS